MRAIISGLMLALFVSAAHAATAMPVTEFLHVSEIDVTEYMPAPVAHWHKALVAALKGNPDPQAAAITLSPQFGLSPAAMLELERLWIHYEVTAFQNLYRDDVEDKVRAELGIAFTALLHRTGHDRLVLLAAIYVTSGEFRCGTSIFDALTDGARDFARTAFFVAVQSACPNWISDYAQRVPGKAAAALFLELKNRDGNNLTDIGLTDILSRKTLLSHVAPKDRAPVRRALAFKHLVALMDSGLIDGALAYYSSLPPSDRRALVKENLHPIDVKVDGLDIPADRWWLWPRGNTSDEMAEYLAAANYLKGNIAVAKKLAPPDRLAAGHDALVCWSKADITNLRHKLNCEGHPDFHFEGQLLDLVLVHAQDDPYDFFELNYASNAGGNKPGTESRLWALVLCKYTEDGPNTGLCRDVTRMSDGQVRWNTSLDHTYSPSPLDEMNPVIAIVQPDAVGIFEVYKSRIDAALPPIEKQPVQKDVPPPSRFKEFPIPAHDLGAAPENAAAWEKSLAPLPSGFYRVRAERQGNRVAMISISSAYDPGISLGGYWLFLSNDGGKTWQRPLYTGIVEANPYRVLDRSNLPMIDGDALDVAVDTEKPDPNSVMIGMGSVRGTLPDRTGIYLRIPISELKRDSDHDGITDIAEEHLLLDPDNPDTDGDGIPDGSDPLPNVARAKEAVPDAAVTALVLNTLFGIYKGVVVRPMDTSVTAISRPETASIDQPLFLSGDGETYGSVTTSGVILVYNGQGITRMNRLTPGFETAGVNHVIFNRAHTRGYVFYGLGAGQGCYRVYRDGDKWKIVLLFGWIS